MFVVKAKIDGVLYNQASSIAFDETSGKKLWISRLFIGHHRGNLGSIGQRFVITRVVHLPKWNRNKLNYRIGPLWSDSVIKLVSDLITDSDQAVRAVHSCKSWFQVNAADILNHMSPFQGSYPVVQQLLSVFAIQVPSVLV